MAETATQPDSTYGKLTDEAIAKARNKIGIWQPEPNPPHNYEVTWDGARHFAFGYGDANPLYVDPEYGKKTRWGGLLAPPTFTFAMGEDTCPKPDAETKSRLKGDAFAGMGRYQAAMYLEWWRPLRLGDRCYSRRAATGVKEKMGQFGGRTVQDFISWVYTNQRGELIALERGMWVVAERKATAERKKEKETAQPYTKEQLAEIDAAYESELTNRRGGEPRYWEDVQIGDLLPTKVRGPLTTTDIVVWHVGWGMELTPPGSFVHAYKVRKKAPGLYPPNKLNVPDTVQRLHWEIERAQELGLPTSYDYGALRETFLCHEVTDWMSDEGWLFKMDCRHLRFYFQGDTAWLKGKVTGKTQKDGRHEVQVHVWIENQRGTTISTGEAVVLLPSRTAGPVVLPEPGAKDLETLFKKEIELLA